MSQHQIMMYGLVMMKSCSTNFNDTPWMALKEDGMGRVQKAGFIVFEIWDTGASLKIVRGVWRGEMNHDNCVEE
jgi:hypothetical protein